ncbi:TcfC domain-containing protein [Vibrio chagasii]|nr:TcfC domain-containing protein [Vibrio chagasii]
MKRYFLLSTLFFTSHHVFSNEDYPVGFRTFFTESEARVSVTLGDIQHAQDITAFVTYDRIKVVKDDEGYRGLLQYLTVANVRNDVASQILYDLSEGVTTDKECQGRFSSCLVSVGEKAKYVFDYDASVLRVILPNNALANDISEEDFASPISEHYGVIHWMNLYANTNLEGDDYVTLSNDLTAGLPLGYLNVVTQYNSEQEFEMYQALYRAELGNETRLQFGKSRYDVTFNATDFLSNHAHLSGYSLYLASSRQLFKGNRQDYQRVYFYAPQAGQIEVYRGNQLLFNRLVTQGAQYISYADLPRGAYQLNLVLNVSGTQVLNEVRQVVNNNQYTLSEQELDYVLGLGRWDKETVPEQDYYLRSLASYRADDQWLLSAGTTTTNDEQYYQLGGQYYFGSDVEANYSLGWFSKGGTFQLGRVSYAPFFLDYRALNPHNDKSRLSENLYGPYRYNDLGIGVSGQILGGNGYLRASRYESKKSLSTATRQNMLYGGWSTALFSGIVDISAQYTQQKGVNDNYSIVVSWSLPLDDTFSVSSLVSFNQDDELENHNYLSMNHHAERWSGYASVGAKISSKNTMSTDITGTVSGSTDWFKGNSYLYLDDERRKAFSGWISGTQAFGKEGVLFSPERGNAFLQIKKSESQLNDTSSHSLKSYLSYSNRLAKSFSLDQEYVLALKDFQSFSLKIDESGYPIEIANKQQQGFVYPGDVRFFDTQVSNLSSLLLVLDDLEGKPIPEVRCEGPGCIAVEPVSDDGVFRVSYRAEKAFDIVSRQGMCIYETDISLNAAKGYCLPGLEWLPIHSSLVAAKPVSEHVLDESSWLFLGRFDRKDGKELLDYLQPIQGTLVHRIVGDSLYLYVKQLQLLTQKQREKLSDFQAILLENDYNLDISMRASSN